MCLLAKYMFIFLVRHRIGLSGSSINITEKCFFEKLTGQTKLEFILIYVQF